MRRLCLQKNWFSGGGIDIVVDGGSPGVTGYEQLSLFRSHNSCRAKLNVNRKYVFFQGGQGASTEGKVAVPGGVVSVWPRRGPRSKH